MALRRAAALVPRLLQQAQQAALPVSSVFPAQMDKFITAEPATSNPFEIFRDSWRRYATDAVTAAPDSKLTPVEKLTVSPSYKIQYDEHNHTRYPASAEGRNFAYFVLTGGRFLYASAIRLAVLKFIVSMSAAADVLALASLEVDLSNVQEGQTVVVKWRGKPVFIRHRTEDEIAQANATPLNELRDAQPDSARVQDPKYLVVVGICTHLGCVPIGGAGDYNGWFCPCHGSHYDISGRIRKGPAPYNLEVPEYKFLDANKVIIG